MKLLLGIIIITVLAALAVKIVTALFSDSARDARAAKKERSAALTAARQRERIATQALRRIANGAGRPEMEAFDALDQIERTYDNKENM